jgi:hypothetical protein
VRLRFGWPVLPTGAVGPKWTVLRGLVSARTNEIGLFEPQRYTGATNLIN